MVPSALRTALITGPGPEGGGSKNSMSRPHCPASSGTAEPPSAAIAAKTTAPAERTRPMIVAEKRRGEHITIPDMGPSWLGSSSHGAQISSAPGVVGWVERSETILAPPLGAVDDRFR